MGEVHGPDACVTAWINIKLFEVAGLPHFHNPVVTSCHQVLSITTQQDSLETENQSNRGSDNISLFGNVRGICNKCIPKEQCCLFTRAVKPHPCGIVDLQLRQKFSVNTKVAEASSLIVNDAVALAGH